jgi:hypothetical protein
MRRWIGSLHAGQVLLVELMLLAAVPISMYLATLAVDNEVTGAKVWVGIWAIGLIAMIAVPWAWLSNRP